MNIQKTSNLNSNKQNFGMVKLESSLSNKWLITVDKSLNGDVAVDGVTKFSSPFAKMASEIYAKVGDDILTPKYLENIKGKLLEIVPDIKKIFPEFGDEEALALKKYISHADDSNSLLINEDEVMLNMVV